ncbi:MAG: preprotein translocase subunit SecG [Peptoniphilaceae bacterium]|uniref:preprotein translocase subunit SecG n=1 Tax=Parvimonas sp. TaxID=1944660 RepID=UPI0025F3B88F|nr:preprotein translocase subunit SecG [Parvimonas sp.]MCI5997565.1 preprotein translocase subunit SecG [Parvimonas sp.]MDD7765160.1 preprotein translocase subunit SecG [Peptoniphilaceae bacterium]MDY3051223.1 preprotein translocase subunit SecG [Parvimonas sp.]
MKTFIVITLLIASLAIIISVLLQESKSEGVASLTGETNIAGKGGKKTREAYLSQITIISSIVFFIAAITFAAIK